MKSKNEFRRYLKSPKIRYVVVGVSVYVLELATIFVAQLLGFSSVKAVALSFIIGLIVSFLLQKFFTFGDRRTHRRILLPQVIAVILLVIFNFCFTLFITQLLDSLLNPMVTRTIALGITTIWNYYLYKTRIFQQPPATTMLID